LTSSVRSWLPTVTAAKSARASSDHHLRAGCRDKCWVYVGNAPSRRCNGRAEHGGERCGHAPDLRADHGVPPCWFDTMQQRPVQASVQCAKTPACAC
jgi:hypothetical protein